VNDVQIVPKKGKIKIPSSSKREYGTAPPCAKQREAKVVQITITISLPKAAGTL
jgi:hypothetical protein